MSVHVSDTIEFEVMLQQHA